MILLTEMRLHCTRLPQTRLRAKQRRSAELINSMVGKQDDPQIQLHPETHGIGLYRRLLPDLTEEHC